uniref:7TM_GPCR_Srx domain-containing protein n=1 Tax=Rhabditophanes sp. KR3021 TaxID=114890 RepID=A0AC35TNA2_9BILA
MLVGLFSITGTDYFTNPSIVLVVCNACFALWVSTCCAINILALQRCTVMLSPKYGDYIFGNKMTRLWLLLAISAGFYVFLFGPAFVWNLTLNTFTLNPYIGYSYLSNHKYENICQNIVNIGAVLLLVLTYAIFFILYLIQRKTRVETNNISDPLAVNLFIQTAGMCCITGVTAVSFVLENYILIPSYGIVIAHVFFVSAHGFNGVLYAIFSNVLKGTIRNWADKVIQTTSKAVIDTTRVRNLVDVGMSLMEHPIPNLTSAPEGILYFSIGVVGIILYIPFFIAMLDKNNFKHPCYRIMTHLAAFDIVNLFLLGIGGGIFSIYGFSYWTYPKSSIIMCEAGYFFWCVVNGDLIVLAIQRCVQMLSPDLTEELFSGNKTFIWLMIPLIITTAMTIVNSVFIYSPVLNVCVLDPFMGYPNTSSVKYESIYQIMENFGNTFILITTYVIFFIILILKKKQNKVPTGTKKSVVNTNSNKSQNLLLFLQTAAICFVAFASNVLFITESYVQLPMIALTVTSTATLLVHAIPPIIFMVANKTLKNTIKGYFKNQVQNKSLLGNKSISQRVTVNHTPRAVI